MKKIMLLIGSLLFVIVTFGFEKKTIYYANGNKHFEYLTTKELLNGEFTAWYENGRLKLRGRFKNNQKNGIWTVWDTLGNIRAQRNYEDDYSFQIIKEWDSIGRLIDPAIIQQKNEQLVAARSKEVIARQLRYIQRFWKSIPANKEANDFLFKDNYFFNYLVEQTGKGTMAVFNDDRLAYRNENSQLITAYKSLSAVEYIIKEDLDFTRDHQVMHRKIITICPVVLINGERKKVGWFYIPDVRNNRQVTDEIEDIVTKLEHQYYAGTVLRSVNADEVTPDEADAISLSPLDWEAQAWITSIVGLR